MIKAEHTPDKEHGQDTAHTPVPLSSVDDQQRPDIHDKRAYVLYRSDLSQDILENPALYMGPADF